MEKQEIEKKRRALRLAVELASCVFPIGSEKYEKVSEISRRLQAEIVDGERSRLKK